MYKDKVENRYISKICIYKILKKVQQLDRLQELHD